MFTFLRTLQKRAAHAVADALFPPPPSVLAQMLPYLFDAIRPYLRAAPDTKAVEGLEALAERVEELEKFTGLRQPPKV